MTEGGDGAKRRWWVRLWLWTEPERRDVRGAFAKTRTGLARHPVARWPMLAGVLGGAVLVAWILLASASLVNWRPAPWWAWTAVGAVVTGLVPVYWINRLEPNRNKQGQFAPRLQRQWLAVGLAILFAVAFEWVLFGLLAGEWTWPWVQVHELNGDNDSLVQPALALLTPVIALVTAVFAYRKSTIAMAESQRADVAAFQQRFIDAAKLMADPNASTRIAGATAMGSLARDWVDNRQECVNVLCGYLKVKPSPEHLEIDVSGDKVTYTWRSGEDEVRLEVVDQLRAVFTPGPSVPVAKTPTDLKLSRAWFPPHASFAETTIDGTASFVGATFTGIVVFSGSRFADEALFTNATFAHDAYLLAVAFTGDAWFDNASFVGDALFDRTVYSSATSFSYARFAGDAWFDHTSFNGLARFSRARFNAEALFEGATFSQEWPSSRGSRQRRALGPLDAGSALPDPPGSIVDEDGTIVGDVEWTRAELED